MSCHRTKELYEELCEYLGQDIEHPMCQELREHVENCPECRQYLKSIKESVILIRKISGEEKDIPKIEIADIMTKIKDKRKKSNG